MNVWPNHNTLPTSLLDPTTAGLRAVTGIDYDAQGRRTRIDHGTSDGKLISTSYTYDRETLRLTHLYTRRGEGVSLWVVPSSAVTASSPEEKDAFFDPSADKPYRHPTFYAVPEGVPHL